MERNRRESQSLSVVIRIICCGKGRDGGERKGLEQEGEAVGYKEPLMRVDPFSHPTNVS